MLNLNYNIIGAQQPFLYRGALQYIVRNDEYAEYIVLALPGSTFRDNQQQLQFGMTNAWDDISSYIRSGQQYSPSGSNLQILVSSSANPASSSISASSDVVKWPTQADGRYVSSVYMNGVNSLVVNKIFNKFEGANFSFSSSFVMETYAAFTEISTASLKPGPEQEYNYSPRRIFAWKYDAGFPQSSQYIWQGNIAVDIDPGIGFNVISGSNAFVYTLASGSGPIPGETQIYPASSSVLIPYQFQHYALVYSSASYGSTPARQLKLYQNGVLLNSITVPNNQELLQDTAELLQVMGAVDNEVGGDAYSGSQVFFNDYRIYNGTDKGYVGSTITPPPSMVVWGGY
jgi:hypothetical protein